VRWRSSGWSRIAIRKRPSDSGPHRTRSLARTNRSDRTLARPWPAENWLGRHASEVGPRDAGFPRLATPRGNSWTVSAVSSRAGDGLAGRTDLSGPARRRAQKRVFDRRRQLPAVRRPASPRMTGRTLHSSNACLPPRGDQGGHRSSSTLLHLLLTFGTKRSSLEPSLSSGGLAGSPNLPAPTHETAIIRPCAPWS
jgi:hypothetical protein